MGCKANKAAATNARVEFLNMRFVTAKRRMTTKP